MAFETKNFSPTGIIGQGTWYLGENRTTFQQELDALQSGIQAGMNLIDTAEMYGEGAAERLVGEAISDFDRESLFVVSKVYPFHAGRNAIFRSCEQSLRRLKTGYLDLYLLHWRGSVPFAETVECMEELKAQGLIRHWGVSNLDTRDMQELYSVPNGSNCMTNQVLYHLGSRGIEYSLLPWQREHHMPVMAYCPLAQAGTLRRGLLSSPAVRRIAKSYDASLAQILLAFLLAQPDVIPIPRSSRKEHTLENAKAMQIQLTKEDLFELNTAFPAPKRKLPLDIV